MTQEYVFITAKIILTLYEKLHCCENCLEHCTLSTTNGTLNSLAAGLSVNTGGQCQEEHLMCTLNASSPDWCSTIGLWRSLQIPTVQFMWYFNCIAYNRLLNYLNYMWGASLFPLSRTAFIFSNTQAPNTSDRIGYTKGVSAGKKTSLMMRQGAFWSAPNLLSRRYDYKQRSRDNGLRPTHALGSRLSVPVALDSADDGLQKLEYEVPLFEVCIFTQISIWCVEFQLIWDLQNDVHRGH